MDTPGDATTRTMDAKPMTGPLNVEMVHLRQLVLPQWNPRRMSDRTLENLMASIREFGFVSPVVVNRRTGEVLGGNQRVRAAAAMGMETIPVIYVDIPEAHAKALNVALNRIGGEFDVDMLEAVLRDIAAQDPDLLTLTGVDDAELEKLLEGGGTDIPMLSDTATGMAGQEEEESGTGAFMEWIEAGDSGEYPFRFGEYQGVLSRKAYRAFSEVYMRWSQAYVVRATLEGYVMYLLEGK